MIGDGTFRLAPDPERARIAADSLFEVVKRELAPILPASAEVLHIGATAIHNCLTKGDLDIVVRVDRADLPSVEEQLATRFARNDGSIRTKDFAAFEDNSRSPHLGIQLTEKGGQFDDFHLFLQALKDEPAAVKHYNALKAQFDGRPMSEYRAAKNAFIGNLLNRFSRPAV